MKRGLLACLVFLVCMHGPAAAQLPRVGGIDFYGLRRLSPADLVAAIGIQIGDSLPPSQTSIRDTIRPRLLALRGVDDAEISFVCCEAGRTLIYIGVRESGSPAVGFPATPTGDDRLPDEMIAAERELLRAWMEGVQRGQAEEDNVAGHSFMKYEPARVIQEGFPGFAARSTPLLRRVLHNSSDAHHRAVAAQIIAYAPDKSTVVPDLVRAMRDADATVRNNAMRALAVIATYAQTLPESTLRVPVDPFIDLLSSLAWTDRNKASLALAALTTGRDPQLLAALRARALDSLAEMARWRTYGHAAPAAIILGRIAGLPDTEIFPKLLRDREALIEAALQVK